MSKAWAAPVVATTIAILAAGAAVAAEPVEVAPPVRLAPAELVRMTDRIENGVTAQALPLGSKAPIVLIARRTKTGDAEIHEATNDMFVVRTGRATVQVGGRLDGARQTEPGEWRGGTVVGAQRFEMGPGDMLWIPAGQPHQVLLPDGGDFNYTVFKSPK